MKIVAEDRGSEFLTRWACQPPPQRGKFVVVRDEWDTESEPPVRTIFEWRRA